MGRRPALHPDIPLTRFLIAVYHHPWATPELIERYTGLKAQAIWRVAQRRALKLGLVERCDLPGDGRPARRFALTPKGAAHLGRQLPRARLRDVLLRAHHLDVARQLLSEWEHHLPSRWSCSPVTLSATCVRPPRLRKKEQSQRRPEQLGDGAYRSLRFDALTCVQIAPGQYRHVAVWVDYDHLNLDWFYYQFRSAYAWSQRPEFRRRPSTVPLFVVVAADWDRGQQLLKLWRDARPGQSGHCLNLRLTTRAMLDQPEPKRQWSLSAYETVTGTWGPVYTFEHLTVPPSLFGEWWGETETTPHYFRPSPRKRYPQSLLTWAERTQAVSARAVQHQRAIHSRERELLDRVGQYPLITPSDLATVLGHTYKSVAEGMRELYEIGLIHHPHLGEDGYVITSWGLELLAAQAGFTPMEYAKLRRWPIHLEGREVEYGIDLFLSCRRHSQLVLDFLAGLRRYGPRAEQRLLAWNQVQCLTDYPYRTPSRRHSAEAKPLPPHGCFISPDAAGWLRAFDPSLAKFVATDFWLEVDRGTEKGQVLWDKLARYYQMQSRHSYWIRYWPRLLILVEREAEARLKVIERRLIALNQHYHCALDVRLTRADLLDDGKGRLDPTRKAWRTVESSEFVYAFDQPPNPVVEKPFRQGLETNHDATSRLDC